MNHYWFKTKWCWVGWVPATWQGYLITACIIFSLIAVFRVIDASAHSVSDTVIAFFYPNGLALILLFLILCYATGEKPCWNWPAVRTSLSNTPQTKKEGGLEKTVISFDELQRLDLRVAKIEKAERIQNSEKLSLALNNAHMTLTDENASTDKTIPIARKPLDITCASL